MVALLLHSHANELTPWVRTSTPPERIGVFQVHDPARDEDELWFSLWDGARWHGAWDSPEEAFERKYFPTPGSVSGTWEWRGLASNPLAETTATHASMPASCLTPNTAVLTDSFNGEIAPSILTGDSHG